MEQREHVVACVDEWARGLAQRIRGKDTRLRIRPVARAAKPEATIGSDRDRVAQALSPRDKRLEDLLAAGRP